MKITLKIPSVDVMMELQESARTAGIPHCLIRDAGHTQIDPGTKTVLALGPSLASELAPITVRCALNSKWRRWTVALIE